MFVSFSWVGQGRKVLLLLIAFFTGRRIITVSQEGVHYRAGEQRQGHCAASLLSSRWRSLTGGTFRRAEGQWSCCHTALLSSEHTTPHGITACHLTAAGTLPPPAGWCHCWRVRRKTVWVNFDDQAWTGRAQHYPNWFSIYIKNIHLQVRKLVKPRYSLTILILFPNQRQFTCIHSSMYPVWCPAQSDSVLQRYSEVLTHIFTAKTTLASKKKIIQKLLVSHECHLLCNPLVSYFSFDAFFGSSPQCKLNKRNFPSELAEPLEWGNSFCCSGFQVT